MATVKDLMRISLLIVLLWLGGLQTSNAQVIISLLFGDKLNTDKIEFGLAGGPNFSDILGIEAKNKMGLNLALYFNFKLSEDFFLRVEASPKFAMGAKDIKTYPIGDENLDSLMLNGKIKRKLKYMGVPIMARYRLGGGKFFVMGGPQINMRLKAIDEFETTVEGDKLIYAHNVKDDYTLLEVAVLGGIEYKFKKDKGMGLGVRYYRGLTNILKEESLLRFNTAVQVVMTIPIGVGKSESKKE